MKLLTALSVLQIAAISVLLAKMFTLEHTIGDTASAPSDHAANGSLHGLELDSGAVMSSQPGERLTTAHIEQLRNIVHQEVAAALLLFFEQQSLPDAHIAAAPDADFDDGYSLAVVQGEIDYYLSRGEISDMEMVGLQRQIAELDQPGRKEMIRKLANLLRSGDLRGRL